MDSKQIKQPLKAKAHPDAIRGPVYTLTEAKKVFETENFIVKLKRFCKPWSFTEDGELLKYTDFDEATAKGEWIDCEDRAEEILYFDHTLCETFWKVNGKVLTKQDYKKIKDNDTKSSRELKKVWNRCITWTNNDEPLDPKKKLLMFSTNPIFPNEWEDDAHVFEIRLTKKVHAFQKKGTIPDWLSKAMTEEKTLHVMETKTDGNWMFIPSLRAANLEQATTASTRILTKRTEEDALDVYLEAIQKRYVKSAVALFNENNDLYWHMFAASLFEACRLADNSGHVYVSSCIGADQSFVHFNCRRFHKTAGRHFAINRLYDNRIKLHSWEESIWLQSDETFLNEKKNYESYIEDIMDSAGDRLTPGILNSCFESIAPTPRFEGILRVYRSTYILHPYDDTLDEIKDSNK